MADDLADGEFWLPSQFLTDDDILQDFKSDVGSLTTETETSSDDDDGLLLPRKVLGSPQSTLCGWDHGSPTVPESPAIKPEADGGGGGATLDLLNKAAGEVAKMKLRTEMNKNGSCTTTTTVGTGFFDCSVNAPKNGGRMFSPSQPPQHPPLYPPQFYAYPHFRRFPHLMWIPPPPPPPQVQNRASNNKTATNNNNNSTNNNRPLGLPPSAWPPLPGQAQAQTQAQQQQKQQTTPSKAQAQAQQSQTQQPMMRMYVGPQSVSVGTGVFLPRRVTNAAAAEPKKKSDFSDGSTVDAPFCSRFIHRPALKLSVLEFFQQKRSNIKPLRICQTPPTCVGIHFLFVVLL